MLTQITDVVVGRDEDDSHAYGTEGTIYIGKHLVGTGEEAHLTSHLLMDVLRPHIITLCGKKGEGKSYSLGVIAEEISNMPNELKKNLCVILIDTQGIFWTMKSPNEKDILLLRAWGLDAKGFPAEVYVPAGQEKTFSLAGVDYDAVFSISPSELSVDDWLNVFSIKMTEPLGILLQMSLEKLSGSYGLDDIINSIRSQQGFENEKSALINLFRASDGWGIFAEARMPELLEGGKISVIDVSLMPQNVRALMLSIVLRKIFMERTKARRKEELGDIELTAAKRVPMPWILIDEAHNFLPAEGATPSSDILAKLVKEGRQPGISMVFATQRPAKLHPDALAQGDIVIAHRLTAKEDIDALNEIMQTYMLFDITKYISELPKLKGVAIILDDNSERIYKVRIRPRQSWHAGASPAAI